MKRLKNMPKIEIRQLLKTQHQLRGDNRYLRDKNKQLWDERDELADELTTLRVGILAGLSEDQLKSAVSNVQVCSLWNEIQRLKERLEAYEKAEQHHASEPLQT